MASKEIVTRAIRRVLVIPAVLAMLLTSVTSAQNDLVLRTTSRLVQVNVIAQNKNGEPVRDLTKDDFVLTDNGKMQAISVFSLEAAEQLSAAPYDETAAQHSLQIENRKERPEGGVIPLTVVLFDTLNTDKEDLAYGRQQVLKFLRTIHRGDPIALYSLNGPQVRVMHDFTDDSGSLLRAVQRLAGVQGLSVGGGGGSETGRSDGASLSVAAFDSLSAFLKEASRAEEANLMRLRAEWTLSALEGVAHHLSGIPGRKNLVWISSSFPITIGLSPEAFKAAEQRGVNQEFFSLTERARNVTRTLSDAGVAIYPIDPRGLQVDSLYQGAALPNEDNSTFMLTKGVELEPFFRTMGLMAQETGGLAFYNANDLAGSMRRAVDDGRVTYLLGFYPPEEAWDGKYHALKVAVRRPGVHVRARNGYLAESARVEDVPERERLLRQATATPFEGVAIGVQVNVESNPLHWWGQEIVLHIDAHDIRFEETRGRMMANVDAVFVQQGSDGATIEGERKTFEYALTPSSYQTALTQGLFYEELLSVSPRAARLRVAVLDASTGAIGSVSIPVAKNEEKKKVRP